VTNVHTGLGALREEQNDLVAGSKPPQVATLDQEKGRSPETVRVRFSYTDVAPAV
jgi:hypothetical protein